MKKAKERQLELAACCPLDRSSWEGMLSLLAVFGLTLVVLFYLNKLATTIASKVSSSHSQPNYSA